MNINDWQGKIKSKYIQNEAKYIPKPMPESDAMFDYRVQDKKTPYFRQLDDLC